MIATFNFASDHQNEKLRQLFLDLITPQNMVKITSLGNHFCFFSAIATYKILQYPDFENLGGLSQHQDIAKNHEASHGTFVFPCGWPAGTLTVLGFRIY